MTAKPTIPLGPSGHRPRIEVDTAEGSLFDQIHYMAVSAASLWTASDDGPFSNPHGPDGRGWTPHRVCDAQLHEALLYLMELGVIDVDAERLAQWQERGYPVDRRSLMLSMGRTSTEEGDA
jgi:hypothetical protein